MKRGISPGLGKAYHQKEQMPRQLKNVKTVQRIARAVFLLSFTAWQAHKEDMIQSAILRCIELAGKSQDVKFQFSVCRNEMRTYIKKWGKGG